MTEKLPFLPQQERFLTLEGGENARLVELSGLTSFRIRALDSLRGLAAFGVLTTHVVQYGFPNVILNHTPFRIFTNGRSFVIFFFVLSGFVLSLYFFSHRFTLSVSNYAARRFCRIYIPYLFSLVLALLVGLYEKVQFKWLDVANYLLMSGTIDSVALNSPSWSLVYEMRVSFAVPVICYLIKRNARLFVYVSAVLFVCNEAIIFFSGMGQFPYGEDSIGPAIAATARIAGCFAAGSVTAYWFAMVQKPLIGFNNKRLLISFIICFC